MRKILFRGKRLDNGEWVEGNLFIPDKKDTPTQICIGTNVIRISYDVDLKTVGQYTGLTDRNGKKIFEGDILKGYAYPFFNEGRGEFNYFAEVVCFGNSPAFGYITHKNPLSKVKGISDGNTDYLEDFQSNYWEVIGNIHDNPDLIGGEE